MWCRKVRRTKELLPCLCWRQLHPKPAATSKSGLVVSQRSNPRRVYSEPTLKSCLNINCFRVCSILAWQWELNFSVSLVYESFACSTIKLPRSENSNCSYNAGKRKTGRINHRKKIVDKMKSNSY